MTNNYGGCVLNKANRDHNDQVTESAGGGGRFQVIDGKVDTVSQQAGRAERQRK